MKDFAQTRVGVVVPIFRHSVLLVDAIDSLLSQNAPFGIQIILVNDGCPHPESDVVCRQFSRLYPERITYLRKPNGGLSDARNHGVRHILANLPDVRAIYFLDADNTLHPPLWRGPIMCWKLVPMLAGSIPISTCSA